MSTAEDKVTYTIKGMDRDVIRLANASRALQEQTAGAWWTEAGREKLAREQVSTPSAETDEVREHAGAQ